MKVEVWSDFACPFCYIGKRRLEEALEQFPDQEKVEVVYRSFELDPNAPRSVDHDVHEMLASKYGMNRSQAIAMNENVTKQAQTVGLDYHLDTLVLTNTFDAHRLAHYAADNGKMKEMTERLLKAYFTDSKHLGDPAVLSELAAETGLDPAEAAKVLAGDAYAEEVRSDEAEAARLGVRGVPFFVINRKYAVSGAQPTEVFLQALQKAWDEDHPLTVLNEPAGGDADACADGVCTPPGGKK
ncbi:DsbA family oxidoreductase [Paenibacillus filicis]|uniref:DsbA family oxidoreductase n=1 Tax=Paenibacillus gyeongsangnamensis TaxID=3388067 RepID=A0ABT4Q575_9BACL|nr:DsbA family oxidoreductase [Paenibacillus filicis]MCZ8511855.1 DsbA family oxidoreductase [Paenibacillus filicis]